MAAARHCSYACLPACSTALLVPPSPLQTPNCLSLCSHPPTHHLPTPPPSQQQGPRSFFSEIISSINDIRFSPCGRYILSRDYMALKLWDINMDAGPLAVYSVHESLRGKVRGGGQGRRVSSAAGCAPGALCWGVAVLSVCTGGADCGVHPGQLTAAAASTTAFAAASTTCLPDQTTPLPAPPNPRTAVRPVRVGLHL